MITKSFFHKVFQKKMLFLEFHQMEIKFTLKIITMITLKEIFREWDVALMEHILKMVIVIIVVLIVKLALVLKNYVQVAKTLPNSASTVVLAAVKDLQAVRRAQSNHVLSAIKQLNSIKLQKTIHVLAKITHTWQKTRVNVCIAGKLC